MHFGAIHSPKFANLLKFYPRAQTVWSHFFTTGATKSATLLPHALFARVNSNIGLVRSRTQLSSTNCATLLAHHLELTMTTSRAKTGAAWINQGHWKLLARLQTWRAIIFSRVCLWVCLSVCLCVSGRHFEGPRDAFLKISKNSQKSQNSNFEILVHYFLRLCLVCIVKKISTPFEQNWRRRYIKFAPMAIPAMALLQQHDARRYIVIEPASCCDRSSGGIPNCGHSELGAQSGHKNPPACTIGYQHYDFPLVVNSNDYWHIQPFQWYAYKYIDNVQRHFQVSFKLITFLNEAWCRTCNIDQK